MTLYKIFLRIVGFIPLLAGGATVVLGLNRIPEVEIFYPSVDSDLRFASGIVAGVGLLILNASINPQRYGELLLFIFAGVLLGNVGRVISYVEFGEPGTLQYIIFSLTVIAASIGFFWTLVLSRSGAFCDSRGCATADP
jgi:uncharacterized membrane protein